MKSKITFREVEGRSNDYLGLVALLGAIVAAGLAAAWYMEHNGHWVTGMTNQIVWGTPHVFAVFLIVAASGALNVASLSSAMNKKVYKPLAPLSGLLALALLAGGLAVLVLDLGRPDRLIVAMTSFNFRSIFAWNIFLYTGFFAIVAAYLWVMMERRMNRFSRPVGIAAFLWRLVLTTGTGSIFGFLMARQAYDAAIMAPMFIVMSFSYGLAFYILVLFAAMGWTGRPLGDAMVRRLKNLLGIFAAGALYFVAVHHLTNLYAAEHAGVERFLLLEGGIYTTLFWVFQVLLGSLLPIALVFHPATGQSRQAIGLAAVLVIVGGLAQMYVTIIGGQAYPLVLFPGMEVNSTFFDGTVAAYAPSLPELLLGVSGIALAMLLVTLAVKFLRFVPDRLDDAAADPHGATAAPAAEPAAQADQPAAEAPAPAPAE